MVRRDSVPFNVTVVPAMGAPSLLLICPLRFASAAVGCDISETAPIAQGSEPFIIQDIVTEGEAPGCVLPAPTSNEFEKKGLPFHPTVWLALGARNTPVCVPTVSITISLGALVTVTVGDVPVPEFVWGVLVGVV